MLRLTWLTVAQHVFQPALTGRLELISRKIVSSEPGTKAIAVSRFREKLSPANTVQGVTAISRKISRSWAPKNGVQHATAIYPIPRYMRPRYIGLTLYVALGGDELKNTIKVTTYHRVINYIKTYSTDIGNIHIFPLQLLTC